MDPKKPSLLVFYVNGKKVTDKKVNPEWTLLDYLRRKLRLCGTKLACGEGGCGACTVMLSRFDHQQKKVQHLSINACLMPVCAVHGSAITTVEGIGSTTNKLHPVQESLYRAHGSQCGFCTPGFVMAMYTLLKNKPRPILEDLETAFQGNLCRCTGYRPILEAFQTFTEDKTCHSDNHCDTGKCGNQCCRQTSPSNEIEDLVQNGVDLNSCDLTDEADFPQELTVGRTYDAQFLVFRNKRVTWYRPIDLKALLQLKSDHPEAKLTLGNTEIGIETKFKTALYPILIAPNIIPELNVISREENGMRFGAATTLSKLQDTLKQVVLEEPEEKTRIFAAIIEMLHWFAGKHVRNVASIAGNIVTASPISDLNPLLVAAGAQLRLASKDGERTVVVDDHFFTGYRKTMLRGDEIILSVTLPYSRSNEYFCGFKQSQRRDDDIAIVSAGMRVVFEEKTSSATVHQLSLAFGGLAPKTVTAVETVNYCRGKKWNNSLLSDVCGLLARDFPLEADAPGGMVDYRQTMAVSFFFKFYHRVLEQLLRSGEKSCHDVNENYEDNAIDASICAGISRIFPSHSQLYKEVDPCQSTKDLVGKPIPHYSAALQTTGEAVYMDDIPPAQGELFLTLITSTRAHARILSVQVDEALAFPGVKGFVSARDLSPCRNWIGVVENCEPIFASEKVTCQGQVIGGLMADDEFIGRQAAQLVKIKYEDVQPLVLTIEDAIAHNSFFHHLTTTLRQGNAEEALLKADHVLRGEFRMGGQEHFYMEPQGCLAIPSDHREMEVISSTQNPSETQKEVAHALNVPLNRVVCKVKRIGGGFGGKEYRSIFIAVVTAVAAKKVGRPVRCVLRRDEDMAMSGNRHPFLCRYKVGFSKEGLVTALDVQLYGNAGNTVDLSFGVLTRALFHLDNAYRIPHLSARGFLCKTNLPSNTAFRGFGGPQGMMATENWMQDIGLCVGKDPAQVREMNLYKENDFTHYNQVLEDCSVRRCWSECARTSDYVHRKEQVCQFNEKSVWKKRGIEMTPVKFGIAFGIKVLNQSGALVHVYKDGSVLITHSGVEMGQGLHTKMIQVANRALGVDAAQIHISETSTDKVPNTPPTAASVGSDLNGMAILNACQTLLKRLQPYKDANPTGSWENWVHSACMDRVSLSATGYYKIPNLNYDWATNRGRIFDYFTYGVACSEVEVDCLTGNHQVLRTDIVMDLGESLNPAVDIGQIEGAFVQGYGLMTFEEIKYSPKGFLYSRGPGTYKIPSFGDIPHQFHVTLLKNCTNPRAVYSSKAVGEPPLFLASSAFFAIKEAIRAARLHHGLEGRFELDSPATPEKIRMAIGDPLAQQFLKKEKRPGIPWSIGI